MGTSAEQLERASAQHVTVSEDTLVVELKDGRTISAPVSWYPRLEHATDVERNSWELIGCGTGIHWEAVDEDISIEALLAGKPSNESQESLKSWLDSRSGA